MTRRPPSLAFGPPCGTIAAGASRESPRERALRVEVVGVCARGACSRLWTRPGASGWGGHIHDGRVYPCQTPLVRCSATRCVLDLDSFEMLYMLLLLYGV